jgi:acetyl esterase/lipase
MRAALSQLSVSYPPTARTEWIESAETPGLRSAYVHLSPQSATKPRVLFWVYGGAFISGDVEGNAGIAEHYGRMLKCDVFVVDMRLCPENTVQDAILDLYRGYAWLLERVPAENIMMLGISSGGGACLRMLQLAGADDEARKSFFGPERGPLPVALPQPAGAILLGAFVEYTKVTESMQENTALDWIVTPSVFEVVTSLWDRLCGDPDRLEICSPLHQTMKGLCPLYISVSEHECLIDEDLELAMKAKAAGVDVALSTRPFLCHVYQLLSSYLPEAAEEEAQIFDWVKTRGDAWASKAS